jgi:hypothetical protein
MAKGVPAGEGAAFGACQHVVISEHCDVPILMEVTRCPHALSSTPTLLAVTPLPRPETTPPVTSTYFMVVQEFENQVPHRLEECLGLTWSGSMH